MDELLADYPVIIEFPIAWGDMDAFNHVNNIMYLRYFESARVAHFARLGFMRNREETGIGPILHSLDCRYRIPLTYPDVVRVGSTITEIGEDRFVMHHRAVSLTHGKTAAEGSCTMVSFDYNQGKKCPLPEAVRQKMLGIQGGK